MSPPLNIPNVVGARPNFLKIAPLIRAMTAAPGVGGTLMHTDQHCDPSLSLVVFEEFEIPYSDADVGVGAAPRREPAELTEQAFQPLVRERYPDVVLVVGDVNSTIACAAVARRHGVKDAHVEADLHGFDRARPGEHNRLETVESSDLLFVTERSGLRDLEREGGAGRMFFVCNVMVDTLAAHLERARAAGATLRHSDND